MSRKLNRWLRSRAGKRVFAGFLAILAVLVVVGQLLGWWSGIFHYVLGTVSKDVCPSEVILASFTGVAADGQVALEWKTEIERCNLGFDLFRTEQEGGPFVQLNSDGLIPSQASEEANGAAYGFSDESAAPGVTYYYWLESMDDSGFRKNLGSVTVEVPLSSDPSPEWSDYVFLPLVRR